jgi:hypothetical protein
MMSDINIGRSLLGEVNFRQDAIDVSGSLGGVFGLGVEIGFVSPIGGSWLDARPTFSFEGGVGLGLPVEATVETTFFRDLADVPGYSTTFRAGGPLSGVEYTFVQNEYAAIGLSTVDALTFSRGFQLSAGVEFAETSVDPMVGEMIDFAVRALSWKSFRNDPNALSSFANDRAASGGFVQTSENGEISDVAANQQFGGYLSDGTPVSRDVRDAFAGTGRFSEAGAGTASEMPILLDLDDDGIEANIAGSVFFDFDDDGYDERTAWAGADDAFLVIDLAADGSAGGDGRIDQAKELAFPNWLPEDQREGTPDLEALAQVFNKNLKETIFHRG